MEKGGSKSVWRLPVNLLIWSMRISTLSSRRMISVYRCVFVSFTGRGPPRRRCSLHWPLTGLKWGMITWMRSVLPQRSGPNITTNGVSSRSSSAERMDPSRSSLMYAPPHSSGFWNRTSYCRIRSFSVLSMG